MNDQHSVCGYNYRAEPRITSKEIWNYLIFKLMLSSEAGWLNKTR